MNLIGTYTALVTPLLDYNTIDFISLKNLINIQINNNIEGIVILGSTGEANLLTLKEKEDIIKFVTKIVNKRTKIIIGTSAITTLDVINNTKLAINYGADAVLISPPSYIKPSQEGIKQFYTDILNETNIPIIIYNIPSRTGCNIEVETVIELNRYKNIVAIKEASGSMNYISELTTRCDISILSGNDDLILPIMSLGGIGCISVLSNLYPGEIKKLVDSCNNNKYKEAQLIHNKYYKLIKNLFTEPNPVCIKYILNKKNLIKYDYIKKPLTVITGENKLVLDNIIN